MRTYEIQAAVEQKLREGFERSGGAVMTGAKVDIEGEEIPKIGQTMIKKEPAQ